MKDPIREIKEQMARLKREGKRDHEHLLLVMATQRERMEKAFTEVNLALLEQELTVRQHLHRADQNLTRLGTSLLQTLSDHETRIRRLEGDPPAA